MNIIGPSSVSVEAAQAWARKRNSHERFVNVAPLYWQIAPRYGIPPEIPYAQASHETDKGHYTGVVSPEFHNWCGLKTRAGGSNSDPKAHQRFPDDATGVLAHVQHLARYAGAQSLPEGDELVDPRWGLVTKFTHEVEGLGGAWAPSRTYGNGIAALAADLREFANHGSWEPVPTPTPKPRVALAAGHHNTSGGNATEHEQAGRLTPAVAAAMRARGLDVRVITPNDGAGDFPGDLSAVAAQVTADDDCFIEIHTEGNNAGDRGRGVFVIYPDWNDDVDTDVRDTLGPAIATAIRDRTGIPLRGSGVMSERQTGVGAQGHRLGVFGGTARHKATCTRMIVEVGSHSSPADMALWRRPEFISNAASSIADQVATFYGLQPQPMPAPEPQQPDAIELNGYRIVLGFKGFWEELAGYEPTLPYRVLGLPLGNEKTVITGGLTRAYQEFERGWLKWVPEESAPWHIHLALKEDHP